MTGSKEKHALLKQKEKEKNSIKTKASLIIQVEKKP